MVRYLGRILAVGMICFFVGCTFNAVSASAVDEDVIQDGTYRNEYFALKMQIPDGWKVLSVETKDEIKRRGKEILGGDDKNMQAAIRAGEKNGAQLLSMSKYPLGTPGKKNVLFVSGAEKVSAFPGIKNGSDYLMNAKELVKLSNVNMRFDKEIYNQKIDGIDFAVMEISNNSYNIEAKQLMYATVIKEYAYYFSYTYMTPQDLQFLNTIINGMKFKQ